MGGTGSRPQVRPIAGEHGTAHGLWLHRETRFLVLDQASLSKMPQEVEAVRGTPCWSAGRGKPASGRVEGGGLAFLEEGAHGARVQTRHWRQSHRETRASLELPLSAQTEPFQEAHLRWGTFCTLDSHLSGLPSVCQALTSPGGRIPRKQPGSCPHRATGTNTEASVKWHVSECHRGKGQGAGWGLAG